MMYLKRRGGTGSGKERWNSVLGVDENERKNRREISDYRGRLCPFKKSGGSYGQRSRTNTISNKNTGTKKPARFLIRKRKQPSTEISRVTESRHCEKFRRSDTIWDIAEAQSSKNCWRQRPENNEVRSSSTSNDRKRLIISVTSKTHLSSRTANSVASNLPSASRSPIRKIRRITVHQRNASPEPRKRPNKNRSDTASLARRPPNTTVSNKGQENVDNVQKIWRTRPIVFSSSTKHLKISDGTSRSCRDPRVKSTISCPNSSTDFKHSQTKKKKVADRHQQHEQNYKSATYRTLIGSNSRTRTKSETKCGSKSSNGARMSTSTRHKIEPDSASRKKDAQIDNGRRATKNSLPESKRKSTHSSHSSGMFTRLDSGVRTNSSVQRSESKLLSKVYSEKEKKLESRPKKKAANNHSSTVIEEKHRRCHQQQNEGSGLLLSGLIKSGNNHINNNSCADTTKKRATRTGIFRQAGLSRQLCGEQLFGRVVQHISTLQSLEALSDQDKQSQRTHIEKMMEAPGRHYRKSEQTNLLINLGLGSAFRPLSCQREMTIRRQLLKLPGLASSIYVQEWIPVNNPHHRNSQQMEALLEQALHNLQITKLRHIQ